ncbi:intracellular septation protein [Massilia yuzhufengensis]|uniref:Inner membrane-spanning protein YciB n=1 Tax=Massilia yuzhufengensis TaxID=1164594 RepID=A0A1I1S402_9BURK|nr:intracellular septation protein [Massilia yuzhufengensis]
MIKFLFDMLPVILFFGMYKYGESNQEWAHGIVTNQLGFLISGAVPASQSPILLATVVTILATVLQIAYLLARRRKVDGMLWLSLGVVVVAGGATIYFHDDTFIKWKPTILYWAFGAALLLAHLIYRKNLMRSALGAAMNLPEAVWTRVLYAWIAFFVALGLLNLLMAFVVFSNDTGAWVSFKLFGITGILFAFIVIQSLFLSKHIQEDA